MNTMKSNCGMKKDYSLWIYDPLFNLQSSLWYFCLRRNIFWKKGFVNTWPNFSVRITYKLPYFFLCFFILWWWFVTKMFISNLKLLFLYLVSLNITCFLAFIFILVSRNRILILAKIWCNLYRDDNLIWNTIFMR